MPNHVHLLVERTEWPLSSTIGLILNSYAKYLNARLKRTGHVFGGRFKSRLCGKDAYFQQLVRYIHLNPVKAGLAVEPAAWPYSGHTEYLGSCARGLIDQTLLLSMFHSDVSRARLAYPRFVTEGLTNKTVLPEDHTYDSPAVRPTAEPLPSAIHHAAGRASLEAIAAEQACAARVAPEMLKGACKVPAMVRLRRAFMQKAFRAGYSYSEIAAHLGLSGSAVSKALRW